MLIPYGIKSNEHQRALKAKKRKKERKKEIEEDTNKWRNISYSWVEIIL